MEFDSKNSQVYNYEYMAKRIDNDEYVIGNIVVRQPWYSSERLWTYYIYFNRAYGAGLNGGVAVDELTRVEVNRNTIEPYTQIAAIKFNHEQGRDVVLIMDYDKEDAEGNIICRINAGDRIPVELWGIESRKFSQKNSKKMSKGMDIREIIAELEMIKNGYLRQYTSVKHPKIDKLIEDVNKTFEMAYMVLEKQIPKKPITTPECADCEKESCEYCLSEGYGCSIILCPNCKDWPLENEDNGGRYTENYCPNCGQAIDWGKN